MSPRFWLPLFPFRRLRSTVIWGFLGGLSGHVPVFCAIWYDSRYLLRHLRSLFGNRDRYAQCKLYADQSVEIPRRSSWTSLTCPLFSETVAWGWTVPKTVEVPQLPLVQFLEVIDNPVVLATTGACVFQTVQEIVKFPLAVLDLVHCPSFRNDRCRGWSRQCSKLWRLRTWRSSTGLTFLGPCTQVHGQL